MSSWFWGLRDTQRSPRCAESSLFPSSLPLRNNGKGVKRVGWLFHLGNVRNVLCFVGFNEKNTFLLCPFLALSSFFVSALPTNLACVLQESSGKTDYFGGRRADWISTGTKSTGIYPNMNSWAPWSNLIFLLLSSSSSSILGMRRGQHRPSQVHEMVREVSKEIFGQNCGCSLPRAVPGLCPCRCLHPQQHRALSLWQSDRVINFRAIVPQWQALIYSPGNSFWFKVHIRCVNAP